VERAVTVAAWIVAIALAVVVLALAATTKTRPNLAINEVSPVSPRPAQAITPAALANLAAADRRYSTWQATRSHDRFNNLVAGGPVFPSSGIGHR
jgi:hypothetical protein